MFGATKTFGPQKGIAEERLPAVDGILEELAAATDRRTSLEKGAGAAGGLGFALLLLGADRRPGFDVVAEAVDLPARARAADLVVTGEGAFDFSSRSGQGAVRRRDGRRGGVAAVRGVAGRVLVGSREMRALGIESAYSLVELVGEDRALHDPARSLAELAARVARTWSQLRRPPALAQIARNNPVCDRIGPVIRASHQ